MKNFLKNIIALIILGIVIFVFRDSISKSYFILQDKYFPCTRTISYSIDAFDTSFGIDKEDFLNAIKEGESMWETSIHKDLFVYKKDGGELKINLVYDDRQKTTQRLKNIDRSLEYNKSSYDDLKNKLDVLRNEYENKKRILESKTITKNNIPEINNLRTELNNYVNEINKLANELNRYASSYNNQAEEYNSIGDQLGEEFEEGVYHTDKNGKKIEIYQFENTEKLTRVLMHEMRHALNIEHINNPDAIMFSLNSGTNLIPTEDDINALKMYCN